MEAEIEVWRCRTELGGDRLATARSHLSPREREREARLVRSASRDRFAAAHGQLREILAERLGIAPAAVPIVEGPNGKPRLDPAEGLADLRLNLSHSGDRALIALAAGREVGADIELHRPDRGLDGVARRFMSPGELDAWRAILPPAKREAAFYAAWTRKEAYAKGVGEGLGLPLAGLELEPVPGREGWWWPRRAGSRVAGWEIADVEAGPGYSAAAAVEGEQVRMVVRDLK